MISALKADPIVVLVTNTVKHIEMTVVEIPVEEDSLFSQRIPVLPLSQLKRFSRLLTDYFGLSELQLQENAGRMVAALVRELFGPLDKLQVGIVVGTDFKAGVALAAARFLKNRGVKIITALLGRPENESSELQLEILKKMTDHIHVLRWPSLETVDVIIDGIAGFTLDHPPSGRMKEMIDYVQASNRPVLSIEIPSGINAVDGRPFENLIRANGTIALGIPKEPLFFEPNRKYVGSVYLADVGIPSSAYEKLGIKMPNLFAEADVIRLIDR